MQPPFQLTFVFGKVLFACAEAGCYNNQAYAKGAMLNA